MINSKFLKNTMFLLLITSSNNAFSWGDIGHSAVAEIAEKNLTPKARDLVFSIIGLEPMPTAATFPDSVRSDSRFGLFAPYHFLEIPIGKTYSSLSESEKPDRNADTIIKKVPEILISHDYSREQKMILIRYLIHVVGDVHQPLHVGNGKDMGANLCEINWKDPETGHIENSNLHSFMDDLIVKYIGYQYKKQPGPKKKYFGYKELAEIIQNDVSLNQLNIDGPLSTDKKNIINSKPEDWYEQSRRYHKIVYPDSSPTTPEQRKYCKLVDPITKKVINGAYDPKAIPTISLAQADQLIPIVKLQILRGGYRLADILNRAAEKIESLPTAQDRQLVDSILITNKNDGQRRQPQNEKKK